MFEHESGTMSSADFRNILTNMGERLTDEQAEEIIRDADIDGEGHFQVEEFVKMLMTKYLLT